MRSTARSVHDQRRRRRRRRLRFRLAFSLSARIKCLWDCNSEGSMVDCMFRTRERLGKDVRSLLRRLNKLQLVVPISIRSQMM